MWTGSWSRAPAFSALGLLVADYVVDIVRAYVTPLSGVDLDRLRGLMRELDLEVDKELAPADLDPALVDRELFVQMAYAGQNFDMSVPCPEGQALDATVLLDLADRFHDQHQRDRGFAFRNQQPVLRGARLMVRGTAPSPSAWRRSTAKLTSPPTVRPRVLRHRMGRHPGAHPAGQSPRERRSTARPSSRSHSPSSWSPRWSATLADHAAYELRR